jgi:hypothetical protein
MYFPWNDLQFLAVTATAGLALGWLCWPLLRNIARPASAPASPCARCAVGAAASCAAHAKLATATPRGEDGSPLVTLGRARTPGGVARAGDSPEPR